MNEVAAGDIITVEIFVSNWDAQPARGFCDGDPATGQNNLCTNIGSPLGCTGKHCTNNGLNCVSDAQCAPFTCVTNTCQAFPRLGASTATVAGASLLSGDSGSLDFHRVSCDPADCTVAGDDTCPCSHGYTASNQCTCVDFSTAACDGTTDVCGLGASGYIEKSRADYIFVNKATLLDLVFFNLTNNNVEYTTALFNPLSDGLVDNGSRRYLGTLLLEASPTACGTFEVAFVKDSNFTFVLNVNALALDGATYQDLLVNLPTGTPNCGGPMSNCDMIANGNPVNCDVDGRQPHDIANAVPAQGINSVDLTLAGTPCNAGTLTAADFSVSVVPAGGPVPAITSVTGAGTAATINLSAPIPPQKWTCITRTSSGDQYCLGFLPGDVNGNLTANTADVAAAIGSLNGMMPEPLIGTDTNRSTIHTAEDLVRLLDLFNGGGAYSSLLNSTLPACPSP